MWLELWLCITAHRILWWEECRWGESGSGLHGWPGIRGPPAHQNGTRWQGKIWIHRQGEKQRVCGGVDPLPHACCPDVVSVLVFCFSILGWIWWRDAYHCHKSDLRIFGKPLQSQISNMMLSDHCCYGFVVIPACTLHSRAGCSLQPSSGGRRSGALHLWEVCGRENTRASHWNDPI